MDLGFSLFFPFWVKKGTHQMQPKCTFGNSKQSEFTVATYNIIIHLTSLAIFFCIRLIVLHFVCQSHQPDLLGRSLSALEGLVYIHSRTRLFTTLHISPKKNFSFCVYFHILEPISTIHSHDSYLWHTIWS